jgi:hypothetical protein
VAAAPGVRTATEEVLLSPDWKVSDGVARSTGQGARLTVKFTGNRIDLLGRHVAGGGSARVLVDGLAADQAPVFFTTRIEPQPKSLPLKLPGPGPADIAPHAVELGDKIVPQKWTITVTSDKGDYKLEGSLAGPDGEGNVARPFTSTSGQIRIDPALWRHGLIQQTGKEPIYGNRRGDRFTFEVYRCAVGEVSFSSSASSPFHLPLVQNLPNGPHVLEIAVEAFQVYQPPEK